jgi:hypothetical protein
LYINSSRIRFLSPFVLFTDLCLFFGSQIILNIEGLANLFGGFACLKCEVDTFDESGYFGAGEVE